MIPDEQVLQEKVETHAKETKEPKMQQLTNPPVKKDERAAPALPAKTSPSETRQLKVVLATPLLIPHPRFQKQRETGLQLELQHRCLFEQELYVQ